MSEALEYCIRYTENTRLRLVCVRGVHMATHNTTDTENIHEDLRIKARQVMEVSRARKQFLLTRITNNTSQTKVIIFFFQS